nr:type II secretion system protein N [Alkalimarinus sediminis]
MCSLLSTQEEKSHVFKKILLLVLVGVVSYTCFLIATLPASFVWKHVSPRLPLKSLQLDVKGVSGTVWNGAAHLRSKGVEGVLQWDIRLSGLFTGSLPVEIVIKSSAGMLTTNVRLHSNGVEVSDTKGDIALLPLNPALKRQRVTLNGTLNIDRLSVGYFDGVLTEADGLFGWTGGRVEYPAGREVHGNEFPSFTGKLSQASGITSLMIQDAESSINSIEGTMDSSGVATLKVKRRLLDLANEPWPKNSTESDVVFKIRRKVL